eukprot:TRINITY_DN68586_c0_g1_i1.p1 TRINITY_DN68586_c0_g1~~TRINITY_DN68586_c0_g1_i1.p1  ORF type:complete len:340 (-),score=76.50 TRINITY_DN68586_c0_g1_i1:661-1680(-)
MAVVERQEFVCCAPRRRKRAAVTIVATVIFRSQLCGAADDCWHDIFQFEDCCAPRHGQTGHSKCWVGDFNYVRCCGSWHVAKVSDESAGSERGLSTINVAGSPISEKTAKGEVEFWRNLFKKGEMDKQLSPDFGLQAEVQQVLSLNATFLTECFGEEVLRVDLLDVGSGPLSVMGRRWSNCPAADVHIVQVDPLADYYRDLLVELGHTPPTLLAANGEKLPFGDGEFQLVFSRNAIDHTSDPVKSILEMIRVARTCVVLAHQRNEGFHGNYAGWHFWNFDVDYEKHLIIWARDGSRIDITRFLEGFVDVRVFVHPVVEKEPIPGIRNRELVTAVLCRRF